MATRRYPDSDDPLEAREVAVLHSVVRAHIASGQPVGSVAVARCSDLGLSSASIRAIMCRLAERGFLSQPHRSAGRLPTDQGYRSFADRVVRRPPQVPAAEAREIEQALAASHGALSDLLEVSSRQLSQLSHQIGIVLAPDIIRVAVDRLEFVPLGGRRVMAIIVGRGGAVHHRLLVLEQDVEPVELERVGRFLTDDYRGHTLVEILEMLRRRRNEERATFDQLQGWSLTLCREAVEAVVDEGGIFVEGALNLLDGDILPDLDVVRALFRTLEAKQRLIDLLGQLVEGRGVQVVIGDENEMSDLSQCTVVASSYGAVAEKLGTVGIVGPKRMEYAKVIPLVGYLARVLSARLSADAN